MQAHTNMTDQARTYVNANTSRVSPGHIHIHAYRDNYEQMCRRM